jgi:hypothetical protein
MVVIAERHESEGLKRSFAVGTKRAEHLGHSSHWATLDLEGYLNKIALAQRSAKAQQTASNGNRLELSFGALTIFQHDQCRNRTTQLNPRRAVLWMHLGEVSHANYYSTGRLPVPGYGRRMYGTHTES